MAGIDKMNHFYITSERFGFLASAYRPDDLPKEVNEAMDILVHYFCNDVDFKKNVEEAREYFEEAQDRWEMMRRKEVLADLVKECSR